MARKRAALNERQGARPSRLADFSQAEPVKSLPKAGAQENRRSGAGPQRIAKLSAVFSAYPEVLSSAVSFRSSTGSPIC